MDIQFGKDGSLYLLTYGDGFFAANPDAGMYRFDYLKGQRAPRAVLTATPTSGQEPLTVSFSSAGSSDADPADSISFAWDFDGNGTTDSIDAAPTHVYTTTGQYTARLTVTDTSGKTGFASTVITVGNTAPSVTVTTPTRGRHLRLRRLHPVRGDGERPGGRADRLQPRCSSPSSSGTTRTATPRTRPRVARACSRPPWTTCRTAATCSGSSVATYTDHGDGAVPALTTTDQVEIRQRRQEVEFVVEQIGTNTSSTTDVGGGLQRGSLGNGDWLQLNGPFNLTNIDSLTLRTSADRGPPRASPRSTSTPSTGPCSRP